MATFVPVSVTSGILYADHDTQLYLPSGPPNGQPMAPGYEITTVDNLQISATNTITINAPLAQSVNTTTLSTNGGSYKFKWTGAFYSLGV